MPILRRLMSPAGLMALTLTILLIIAAIISLKHSVDNLLQSVANDVRNVVNG